MLGTLLVAGTGSDAGKSVPVTGLVPWLFRQGVKVAPFKAQNMSHNSYLTIEGGEIGRAQAMQAAAAGWRRARNEPVLLKPSSDGRSQVIVRGHPVAKPTRRATGSRPAPARVALDRLRSCGPLRRGRCEGAGSPAEINLRENDIVNMGVAGVADAPVVVVADIDRGGVFAACTAPGPAVARRPAASQASSSTGSGASRPTRPGMAMLGRLTGRPALGVVPWPDGLARCRGLAVPGHP